MSEIDTSPEAIAAIMEGVTPPPWCAGAHRWPEQVGCCPLVGRPFSAHRHLRNVAAANTEADIRFIAASRDLVPALAAERDALRAEVERLRDAASKLAEALRWYISEDETNEGEDYLPDFGGSWNDINDYWIAGKRRASESLASWEASQK